MRKDHSAATSVRRNMPGTVGRRLWGSSTTRLFNYSHRNDKVQHALIHSGSSKASWWEASLQGAQTRSSITPQGLVLQSSGELYKVMEIVFYKNVAQM